jgi:hypothetical protein
MNVSLPSLLGQPCDVAVALLSLPTSIDATEVQHTEGRTYVDFRKSGIGFELDTEQRVVALFLHSAGHEDFQQCVAVPPDGIMLGDNQAFIEARLGRSTSSGGGSLHPILGKTPRWSRYERSGYVLHIQFQEMCNAIDMITIMAPHVVPK